ncbi:MAG: 2-dehydropantoate 2-reductase [Kiritimatiellae bacterium]|jgi:uncharacterized HAD superfamily protein|nr:2-dehydropantoate 2-reductase [Kiritimatiellia bacterium]
MRIYIDFDDVLCETARALSAAAKKVFNRDVPYEKITVFNLQHAFSLSGDEIDQLMDLAHEVDFLAELEPASGAVEAVRKLRDKGHEVVIVTGRPSYCHAGSRAWLKKYGLEWIEVIYVDKYGRAPKILPPDAPPMLTLEQFYKLSFDLAIDDSPDALDLLAALDNCRILIYDRPWNRAYCSNENMQRINEWVDILRLVEK